jgi:hypothetical protein
MRVPARIRPDVQRVHDPLAEDLATWKAVAGRTQPADLVFPSRRSHAWTHEDWRNWRRRNFQPAADASGLETTRPYDLRHSFVSLLIHERQSVVEVARQAGHAPTMTLSTYAHVFTSSTPTIGSARPTVSGVHEREIPTRRSRHLGPCPTASPPTPRRGSRRPQPAAPDARASRCSSASEVRHWVHRGAPDVPVLYLAGG